MPRSIIYRPELIEGVITNERLNSYQQVFQPIDDVELVGAYLWNSHVCSALYPLLAATEITLRNSIDTALRNDIGNKWWRISALRYKSYYPNIHHSNLPYSVKAIRKNFENASWQVKTDKKRRYNNYNHHPTHHEILAKTEFSTWEFMLDAEFTGNNMIWPSNLGRVFRGDWKGATPSTLLSKTKDMVKTVREFRNRVSHHEPVWKKYGVTNETDAIIHLHEKIKKMVDLVSIISPEKLELLEKSGIIERAYRACSIGELRRCQQNFKTHNVKSMSKLCRLVKKSEEEGTVEKITVYKMGKTNFLIQPS